jgi:Protein of unknown function DUF262
MFDPTLRGLLSQVELDKVVLPAMQRPFVWSEERMIRLTDSLLRGFPLGAILLWKTKTTQRYRRFRKDIDPDEAEVFQYENGDNDDRYLVLDGQQRLTSLLAVLRGTYDNQRFYLDVLSGQTEEKDPGNVYYDGSFMTAQTGKADNATSDNGRRLFLPIQELAEIDPVNAPALAFNRGQELKLSQDQIKQMTNTYLRCASLMGSHKALQVIFIDENPGIETPVEEILEIFVRVNSGGLVLQKSDLLMSLLDLKWNDIQPELQTIVKELNVGKPFNFTRDDVLKSLLLAVKSETRFDRLVADRKRVEDLAKEMPSKLPAIGKAWQLLAVLLTDDCKIYSERFFRGGHNSLLPFVLFLTLNPRPTPQQKKDLVTGIYMAIMSGVFASAEARMGKYARDHVKAGQPFPLRPLAGLVRKHGVFSLDGLLRKHLDMALNIAHNGITIDGNPDELQRDHIFPRSTLEKGGYPPEQVGHYANFHFLRGTDNGNKSFTPPDKWFRTPGKDLPSYTDQDLAERLLTWDLLEPGAFPKMLDVRSGKIKERAAKLFAKSEQEFDELFN